MKRFSISSQFKITALFLIIGLTFGYSVYEKSKVSALEKEAESPILQYLPDFKFDNFLGVGLVQKNEYLARFSKGVFVHFWGTWCGPCEAELPDFVSFAKKFKDQEVGFLLIAVNDEDKKIKKFMKRFKDLPKNMRLIHDKTGVLMSKFGTVKVPETYLFNPLGKNLKKYVGPQNWASEGFFNSSASFLAK